MASVMWALLALVVVDSWSLLGLLTTQLIASAALYWGTAIEPFNLGMTKVIFRHGAISPEKPPLRILHLSDLHIERLTKREGRLLDLVQDADADLVLITGDYLNLSWIRDETAQKDLKALLTQLSAPYGVYAVLGSPPVDERDVVPALFDGLDIDLLVNENRVIDLPGRVRILLIGADCTHDLQKDRASLSNMHKNEPEHDLSILLYHSPDLFDDAVEHGVALYLCGHTHGGQVRIPGYGALLTSSEFGRRFQMGLYEERETRMYISRGVGLEGLSAPRMRLFCPPEIELIEYTSHSPAPKRD
jgi:hypothetical protein